MCGVPMPGSGMDMTSQILGLVAYAAIIVFLYKGATMAKKH